MISLVAALAIFALFVRDVGAQAGGQDLAEINRVAMEAYNNLDIEKAKAKLEEALKIAERKSIKGPPLALTYANLGIVRVGGLTDNAGGLDAFVRALQEDPSVRPDPMLSSPEIQQVFQLARRKAASGDVAGLSPSLAPVEGNLEHSPAVEQLTRTAVPIFVKPPAGLQVASMKVFYRSLGMPQPLSTDLKPTGDGWAVLIPCTDVFEPNVEYFVVALDGEGTQIGNAGTSQSPISVPIVPERSQPAPSLPGELPPSQCSAGAECSPGKPGCAGQGGLGATCGGDSDCGYGLVCAAGFCSLGSGGDGEDEDSESHRGAPRFYLDLNFGLGLAYVDKGMTADRLPSQANIDDACDEAERSGNCKNPGERGTMISPGEEGLPDAVRYLEEAGWTCTVVDDSDGSNASILVSNCTVAVAQPGFVTIPMLNFAMGYYFTPRFALALVGRLQLEYGLGPLAGILAGARAEYLLTKPAPSGFHLGMVMGAAFGSIQGRPPATGANNDGPYVTSGPMAVQFGLRSGYRFIKNLGFNITPMANFMVPQFLFALDLSGGLELAF